MNSSGACVADVDVVVFCSLLCLTMRFAFNGVGDDWIPLIPWGKKRPCGSCKKIAKKQFSILARRHFVFAFNGGGVNGSYYGDDLALYRSTNIREHFHEIAPILHSCSAWTCAGCTLKSLVLF